ncbi:holo-ACP synthase [Chitinivorax sp. B]|uniref:holo-ACP synthase n=1 Tax=Chitinivorax sp. B TaxID=2502235 RepID=UPI0010F5B7FA|nr:holo-ACP synthase [Chitinivorax sp. B]
MIYGIGTDIVKIARVARPLARYGQRFAMHILSCAELPELAMQPNPAVWLAKRFAAKEAFVKALGTGIVSPANLTNLTITHDAVGKPGFELAPELASLLMARGIRNIHLSIADERDVACAFVILES